MRFYKETNFKDTEIGRIPKDWEVVRLGDISSISSGNTAPQEEKYFEEGKFPFIRVQHLNELEKGKYPIHFDLVNERATSELRLKKFKKGAIIFPKSGESIRLEKRAILKEDSYVVNHLAVIEPLDKGIDNLFLFYCLCRIKTSEYLTQTTMPSLNLAIIKGFLLPLPPLSEQEKIAEILSTLDELIQRTDEIIAKTEQLKKGLMQELLTKGIGHKEFKKTEIGRIPKDWEVVRLGDEQIAEIKYGKGKPSASGKIPVIGSSGVYGWTNQSLIDKPTIVIGRKGSAGIPHLSLTPCWPSDTTFYLDLNLAKVNPKFLYEHLIFKPLSGEHAKTTLPSLKREDLQNFKFPLPPLSEQEKIAEILSTVDEKIEIERKRREKLERIKKSLMDLLLTGKIRVRVD